MAHDMAATSNERSSDELYEPLSKNSTLVQLRQNNALFYLMLSTAERTLSSGGKNLS